MWTARDPLHPELVRAIKLVGLAGTKATQLERVRREARALAKLDHPSLVKCHALFEDLSLDVLGLVLDHVDGPSLEQLLEDARFSELRRTTVLLHVARALAYVHGEGVAHRDLKLENVLVRQLFWEAPDEPSNTKLVDFGIAAMVGSGTALTAVGHIVGTPAYMAPELLDPGHFGAQAPMSAGDVFSFGVLAWALLAGGHPTGLPPGSSLIDYAVKYRDAVNRHPAWEQEPIPGPWGRLLLECVEPDPYRRIPDGAALQQRVAEAHRATRIQFESRSTVESADAPTVGVGAVKRADLVTDYTGQPTPSPMVRTPTEQSAPPSPYLFAPTAPADKKSATSTLVVAGSVVVVIGLAALLAVAGVVAFVFLRFETAASAPTATPARPLPAPPPHTEPALPPTPAPTQAAPLLQSTETDSRRKGCPADVPLCSCCPSAPGTRTCCSSGSDCRGACSSGILATERFHLRLVGASIKLGGNERDAFASYPGAEVCVRVTGTLDTRCTRLSETRSLTAPAGYLDVTGRQLTGVGIDIEVRDGVRTLGRSSARMYSNGILRYAICDGLDYKDRFEGDAGIYRVSFFLDDPAEPAPTRCVAAD